MQQAVSGTQKKIVKFTDLSAWKEAHNLVIGIYKLTDSFPQSEQFGLTSQIRRAAVSVSSNIAEGFSRRTKANKNHFYAMAQGSLTEVQNQLLVSRDVGYANPSKVQQLGEESVTVHKLLTGLLKALQNGKGVKA